MTSNLEVYAHSTVTRSESSDAGLTQRASTVTESNPNLPSTGASFTDDEKFELLSAFLDNEVSEDEQRLVQHWLKSDPKIRQTYQQQLQLKAALQLLSNDFLG